MHVAEKLEALWKLVCCHYDIGLLNKVGSQVDRFVEVFLANVLYLLVVPICWVHIWAEVFPAQCFLILRNQVKIFLASEFCHCARSLINYWIFHSHILIRVVKNLFIMITSLDFWLSLRGRIICLSSWRFSTFLSFLHFFFMIKIFYNIFYILVGCSCSWRRKWVLSALWPSQGRDIKACDFLLSRNLWLVVPPVILNQNNDKALWNQANNLASHVDDWNGVEVILNNFRETLHSADTLNYFNLLVYFRQDISHIEILVLLWQVIPEERHLLCPDCVIVEWSIASLRYTERNSNTKKHRQEVVDWLSSLKHDNC